MSRATVIVGALALFAIALGFAATGSRGTAVDAAAPITSLVDVAPADVALVGVEWPAADERHLYGFDGERWRCRTAVDAVASSEGLAALIADLCEATGTRRVVPAARAAAYGIDDAAPRVTLFGARWNEREDRDALATIVLGDEVEGRRSYVALAGTGEVWEVDRLPARRLEREDGDRLPPLLDRRLLAGERPTEGGGFTRAFLDFADGRSWELARVGPRDTYQWELRAPGAAAVPVLPYRIAGWQSFVYRTPYAGFASPADAARLGLESPWLTITLVDERGSIELRVAEPAGNQPLAVANARSRMIVLLSPDATDLLVPETADFVDRTRPNPWESWLGAGAIRR